MIVRINHKILLLFVFFVGIVSFSQNVVKKDTIPLKYEFKHTQKGSLFLNNPSKTTVYFDEDLQKFVLTEKIGNYYVSTPIYLSLEEYDNYKLKNDIKTYFKQKVAATSKSKKANKEARKNLLPKYYINSKFFESVFGGNEIEVTPRGQVNIKLGGNYQNTENPNISVENQSNFTFDFDQQISASLLAKIGKRLRVSVNYDTNSTFDFQNIIKLEYTPTEDDILQKIDAGNISMPIKNSLITGAQALFGARVDLKFGKTYVKFAYSQQNSDRKTVVAKGGATIEPFELRATDYDNDRHFFLSQYFRNNYKKALENFPLISSPINITRVEVWVTNRNQDVKDYRSIVAFADLGESEADYMVNPVTVGVTSSPAKVQQKNLPYNKVNNIGEQIINNSGIRDIATVSNVVNPFNIVQGQGYSYLQNARKLQSNEFTLQPQLGFISLNRRLSDGEVLAVAFEYTVVGATSGESVFKVGEFSNDGVNAPQNLVVKLLRSETLTTRSPNDNKKAFPTWRLMMKNIYALGAAPLSRDGFRFELLYRDDKTGVLQNTLQNASTPNIQNKTLLNLVNLDKLNQSDFAVPNGDGFFDFVEGITVNSQRGYIIFPEAEPFGDDFEQVLTTKADKDKYVFKDLYLTTKAEAKNEYQNKDKFFLKGYFKTDSERGISLGAFNIPRGSVNVTAGGRQLVEGVDYVVDYQLGIVKIIDPGLESSGLPINASVENNSFFNQQRKTFIGIDVEHRFSDKFNIGATFLNVSEKPITPKVNYGAEPINNVMLGFNFDFSDQVPYLTKLTNKLPFHKTEAESNVSVRGDFAYLLPGTPSGIDIEGRATSYLDDFEASQVPIKVGSVEQWFMSSTPISQGLNGNSKGLEYNYKRGKLAWYSVDQLFYTNGSSKPKNIDDNELSRNEVRRVSYNELYPNTDLDVTQINLVRTLDLAYYPNERGPYNFNTNKNDVSVDLSKNKVTLKKPEESWAGITRPLTTNNFNQANVEYIQFWMLDPYENYSITEEEGLPAGIDPKNPANQKGELYINLGNISEDILPDGRKQYENGLPTDANKTPVNTSIWGKTPKNPSILYAFSNDDEERAQQDVGLDGLNDAEEKATFPAPYSELDDPAGDNFQFFRGEELDAANASILTRYKHYNNTQGNSPTLSQSGAYPKSSTQYPDTEDINKDQTMNTINSYFEYKVSLNKSDLQNGKNFIVDVKQGTSITLPNGTRVTPKWYQFRIPIRSVSDSQKIGGISNFNSIRFMRLFLTGFKMPVVLRMADLELVRGDWRRYTKTLDPSVPESNLTSNQINKFEVGTVSIEQNQESYQIPPGIAREELQGTNRIQRQNEQSITLKVNDLPANKARAVYKNISIDLRRYKNLKMFMHAEKVNNSAVEDDDMVAVIRLGTDLNDNFYQVEVPLKISTSSSTPFAVWPVENNLDININKLAQLKLKRDGINIESPDSQPVNKLYPTPSNNDPKQVIMRVKGNPTLAQIRTVMLGVKNASGTLQTAEVWFNELRAVGFDNKGGWAAVLSADANFADVANVSLSGRISTVGFGSVEQRVQERSIEEVKQYDITTSIGLEKVLTPKKWNLQIPMNYTYGEEFKDPLYDPQYQDVKLADAVKVNPNSKNSQDYTRRKGISFINVKKNRNPESKRKPKFYDVENLSVSYSHSEEFHKDYNIEKYVNKNVMAGVGYAFSFPPFLIEPFKETTFLNSEYLQLIKDFNFNPVPKTIALNSKINRSFNQQQSRNLIAGLTAQPTLTQRRFLFNWDYNLAFDLTKSLQLNFNATNNYIYDNFGADEELEVYDKFFTIGRPDNYHQTLNATYKLPIDKIPFLNFINADYGYNAEFDWRASSQSNLTVDGKTLKYTDLVGNTIGNSNTQNITANIDFKRLYKVLRLDNLLLKGSKTDKKSSKTKLKPDASLGNKITKGIYQVLTSIKNARVSYSANNATSMQGYKPYSGFLGRSNFGGSFAPSLGFVFGSQTDMMNRAIEKNWLVTREPDAPYYNKNYSRTKYSKLDYSLSVRPIKNLTIDIMGNRLKTSNITQQLDVVKYSNNRTVLNPEIKPFETGNFSISHFMLKTMFKNQDLLYNNFLMYRNQIGNRLQTKTGYNRSGFTNKGQQTMLPAFIAAYSGVSPNSVNTGVFRNIPIPNWTLRFNGLMQLNWFKKNFSAFTLTHGYKSSYTISNFTNNLQYKFNGTQPNVNSSGNYQTNLLISSATLIDEFSPLIRMDMRMKNSFSIRGEIKRDRSLTLNFNNSTLTDVKGTEYVLGLGYRIKDVRLTTRITGKKQVLKGDINLRTDFSIRDNLNLIRTIDEDNNQITAGEKLLNLKFVADYNLNKNLTASFYYNHQTFKYAISTTFPRQTINAGLSLIYNIGN